MVVYSFCCRGYDVLYSFCRRYRVFRNRCAGASGESGAARKEFGRDSVASEVYDRLATARADFGQSAGELLEVQKTEGNVAAAKFMANSIKDSTVAMASSVRNSVQNVAGDVKDSAGAMIGRFWKNENLQDLEKSREQMEAQLSVLEDGGNAQSGKMPWWVKTMLRNNPEAVSEESGFDDLKKAAMKPLKEKKERTSL